MNAVANDALAGLAAALLLACAAVGPDYERPTPTTPATFAAANGTLDRGTPITRWWSTFGDAELDRLVDRAVRANRDLGLAAARVREARAVSGLTDAEQWPSLTAAGSYDRSRARERATQALIGGGSFSPGGGREYFQAGFDASWEIDVFGGVRREIEAAVADVEAAEEARRDVLVTVLAEVARSYLELRGYGHEIEITRAHVVAEQATVDLTRARFAARVASELDVLQAAAELELTQARIPTLENAARQARHRLAVLLGEPPGSEVVRLAASEPSARPPMVPVGVPAELLRRRPDLRRAERELAAATARLGVATADLYPRFSLTGSFGLRSAASGDLANANSQFWDLHPSVSWPWFDAGRVRASIAAQDARVEQAIVRYEQAMLLAFEDVENALVAYQKQAVRHAALERSADASRRAVELADQLYRSGVSDFLRVLDAERALYTAEDQLAESERLLCTDLIAVYKALGGGWEPFAPERA